MEENEQLLLLQCQILCGKAHSSHFVPLTPKEKSPKIENTCAYATYDL